MSTRNRFVLAGCFAVLVIGLVAFAVSDNAQAPATPEPVQEQGAVSPNSESSAPQPSATAVVRAPETTVALTKSVSEPTGTATLIVDTNRYALTAAAGSTLKDALDRLQNESEFTYAYRNYSGLGALVTEINGRASTGEYVWILHVNGEKSATGVSSTRIRSGDVIEWKLEKSY